MSDTHLRNVIRQAAVRGPRLPRREASVGEIGRRLSIMHAGAIRRLPADRVARPQMIAAALIFLAHWVVTVVASLYYEHFRPTSAEPAQFVTLLVSSLSVFACSLIAFIELTKFTRAGRSVTIGLGVINVVIFAAVAIYARHWLFVAGQAIFAVALIGLLASRTHGAAEDAAHAPADGERTPRRAVAAGVLLVALAWGVLLVPAVAFAQMRERAEERFGPSVGAWQESPADAGVRAGLERLRDELRWLTWLSDVAGETFARKARYESRAAYLDALLGDPEPAIARIDRTLRYAPHDEAYRLKAQVYAMLHGLDFVPRPTQAELDAAEPPPGHVVPERLRETIRGVDPDSDIWDDIYD